MNSLLRYSLTALVFAVIWTSFMVLWSGDHSTANIVILSVGGLATGFAWTCAMAWYQRRLVARGK